MEIKTPVIPIQIGDASGHFINEDCSIRDILRWLITENVPSEVEYHLRDLLIENES